MKRQIARVWFVEANPAYEEPDSQRVVVEVNPAYETPDSQRVHGCRS